MNISTGELEQKHYISVVENFSLLISLARFSTTNCPLYYRAGTIIFLITFAVGCKTLQKLYLVVFLVQTRSFKYVCN